MQNGTFPNRKVPFPFYYDSSLQNLMAKPDRALGYPSGPVDFPRGVR